MVKNQKPWLLHVQIAERIQQFYLIRGLAICLWFVMLPTSSHLMRQMKVSAAIEYGVRDLKVQHLVILGHAFCGGIQALCAHHRSAHENGGNANASSREFLNSWIDIASPAMQSIDLDNWQDSFQHDAERAAIRNSVANLHSFPWIVEAIKAGKLEIHGWWFDMENGALWGLDQEKDEFVCLAPVIEPARTEK